MLVRRGTGITEGLGIVGLSVEEALDSLVGGSVLAFVVLAVVVADSALFSAPADPSSVVIPVSYTHLTLPTNREV